MFQPPNIDAYINIYSFPDHNPKVSQYISFCMICIQHLATYQINNWSERSECLSVCQLVGDQQVSNLVILLQNNRTMHRIQSIERNA